MGALFFCGFIAVFPAAYTSLLKRGKKNGIIGFIELTTQRRTRKYIRSPVSQKHRNVLS